MNLKVFEMGFNYSQDGPGNRLVIHLSGCNMRCPWCSNPEGMRPDGNGNEYEVEALAKKIISSKAMFFDGGGVTFTGGECTLQKDSLTYVLAQCKKNGIHTAIETNGTSPHLPEIQKHVDSLMMDFKHYDKAVFRNFTGAHIDPLLRNYEYLCGIGRQLHIRIPLINHVNAEDPWGFAEILSRFDTSNVVFEFLPYHEYGKKKWKTEYQITDGFVSADQLRRFQKVFADHHLKTIHT